MSGENQAAMATRSDLAQGARKHYERLSTQACDWYSLIPKAIDSWEREPELVEALEGARDGLWLFIASLPDCPIRVEASEKYQKLLSALSKAKGEV